MLTVYVVLAIIALVCAIASYWGQPSLGIAVVLLCIIELVRALPAGSLGR